LKSRNTLVVLAVGVFGILTLVNFGSKSAPAQSDGKAIFVAKCAACHQANGQGLGPFPPLAGNPDVTKADSSNIVAIVLNGRTGPITVNGKQYGGNMPAWRGQLSNAQIASVLTYIRSAWSNKAPAVSEDQVAAASAPKALSGSALFATKCATCHQAAGQGTDAFPPLAGNPVVNAADPKPMIAIIVNGRSGPLTVSGKTFNGTMPTWKGQLTNADIAAVASYVRSAWGNTASAVTEQQVATAGAPVSQEVGASVYVTHCATCHDASGKGGAGPALAGDAFVTGSDPTAMIKTIEQGRNLMPSWRGQLSASDIAAVATYVRSAWGNKASAVSPADVTAIK
jgi:cbb3-type cytochrome c oxidase subunit III